MVVNNQNEILCVRELRNNYRPWKIPGGLANIGEELSDAAIREVYEETGIRCTFQSILGFRHSHQRQYGKSDLYFVCRLIPCPEEYRWIGNGGGGDGDSNSNTDTGEGVGEGEYKIKDPIADPGEIAAAAWVPLDEFRQMVFPSSGGEAAGHPMMQTNQGRMLLVY